MNTSIIIAVAASVASIAVAPPAIALEKTEVLFKYHDSDLESFGARHRLYARITQEADAACAKHANTAYEKAECVADVKQRLVAVVDHESLYAIHARATQGETE